MSKLDWFTILVIAVCVLAIGALIWNMKGLLGSGQKANTEISEDYTDPEISDSDSETYDINIDGDADGDNGISDNEPNSSGEAGSISTQTGTPREVNEYDLNDNESNTDTGIEVDNRSENDSQSEGSSGAISQRINTNTSPQDVRINKRSGDYMVIVGSYKQMTSAERMKKMLRSKGYRDTEIELFDNGSYARVIVGRYSDYDSAIDLQADLIADGFKDLIVQQQKK